MQRHDVGRRAVVVRTVELDTVPTDQRDELGAGRAHTGAFVETSDQTGEGFVANINREDLSTLSELMTSGKVTPAIDRTYPLSEVPDAIRYWEAGHVRGKVVIDCS
ncbi:MAG: zinc-binding dehydrogenase [bacterium]